MLKKVTILSVITFFVVVSFAVSANSEEKAQTQKGQYEPFTITTLDHEVTYDQVPTRVVSMNAHTSEILLALGLADLMVGTAYNNAEVLPQYKDAMDRIPQLAEKYPSLEVLLDVEPDFVYGRNTAFTEKAVGTVRTVLDNGILVYVCKGSYTPGSTVEDTYEDFEILGRIFSIEDRAQTIINDMKGKITRVQEKVKDNTPVRVFVFDFGGDSAFTACQSLQTNLIELAGGKNIFDDIPKTWAKVSWEEVVERDPEVIVINEYGEIPTEDKLHELKTNPALSEVTAIKNNRFCIIKLPAVFPGIRNADTVEKFAQSFHPEQFQ
jgi:iron complex transport system substrate-binding protein